MYSQINWQRYLATDDDRVIGWVRDTWSEVHKLGTGTTYLNFTGLVDEATDVGVESAFGRNLARLAEIKARYDPDNLFRLNNNSPPRQPHKRLNGVRRTHDTAMPVH